VKEMNDTGGGYVGASILEGIENGIIVFKWRERCEKVLPYTGEDTQKDRDFNVIF
jgi:hypothetical protein